MSDGAHSSISSFDNAEFRQSSSGAAPSPSLAGAASSSSYNSSQDQAAIVARDARIARFYNLDAKRTEGVRAVDILPQLQRCLAYLTGGRDRRGGPVLICPPPPVTKNIPTQQIALLQEEYKIILDYLASIPSQQSRDVGFSIILDLRGSSWSNAKPLLNVLQETFVFPVQTLYVIKPDRFWEKQKAQIAVGKIPFETVVVSVDSLSKYIESDQLPLEMKGTQQYIHSAWIELRMHIEDFLSRALNLLDRLDDLHRVIQSSPEASLHSPRGQESPAQAKQMLDEHCSLKPLVARAPVEMVEKNGRELLEGICGYANAQDSDALSELQNPDLRSLLPLVTELISRLHSKRQQAQQMWYLKRQRLQHSYQLRVFELDCDKLLAWLHQTSADLLIVYSRIGQSRQEANELRAQHDQVTRLCRDFESNFFRVKQVAQQLTAGNSSVTHTVKRAAGRLESEWRNFSAALDERSQILSLAVEFYAHLEGFRSKMPGWHQAVDQFVKAAAKHINRSNENVSSTVSTDGMRADIERLDSLKQEITTTYSELANDGRKLLATIQTPPAPPENSGENGEYDDALPPVDPQYSIMHRADFTEAAGMIMDLAHENLQQFRVLESTVNRVKSHIERELRVKNFHRDVHLVLTWLQEHGETFLRQNRRFGQNWSDAKQFLHVHENFEACAKNAIDNSDKLLKYADQLVHRSICSEQELDVAKSTLQNRVQGFISALETRHDLLNVSMAFYLHADEVAQWLEKLGPELASDDVSAMGGSSEIEEIIFEYQQQRVSTLEAIQRTLDEGNDVIRLYERDLANLPPGDNDSQKPPPQAEQDLEKGKVIIRKVTMMSDEYKAQWESRIQKLTLSFQVLLLEDDIRDLILGFDEMSRALFTSATGGPILGPTSLALSNQSIDGAAKQLNVVVDKMSELKEARQKITLIAAELRKLIETAGYMDKLKIRSSNSYSSAAAHCSKSASNNSLADDHNTGLILAKVYVDNLLLSASQAEAVADENVQRRRRDIEQMGHLVKLETEHSNALFLLRNADGLLGSTESLFSTSCPRDKMEADRITSELDQFFQKTMEPAMVAANQVVESIQLLIDSGCDLPILHQKSEQIVDKWEQLLGKWKDRRKVSSLASQWYETVERVFLVLESLIQEYRSTGDVCQQFVSIDLPRAQLLENAKDKHVRQKEEFLQACTLARRRAAAFLKHLDHYVAQHHFGQNSSAVAQSLARSGSPEVAVRDKLSRLLQLEESVLNCWCEKQSLLEQCLQFALFEASATEVLSRIVDTSQRFSWFLPNSRATSPSGEATKDAEEVLSATKKLKEHADSLMGVGKRLISSSQTLQQHHDQMARLNRHSPGGVPTAKTHLHAQDIANWISRIGTELAASIDPIQKSAARALSVAITVATSDEGIASPDEASQAAQSDASSLGRNETLRPPTVELEKVKKPSRRKDFIVSELIQTEKAYIKNLEMCLKVFVSVFSSSESDVSRPVPPYWVGKEAVIFGNLRDIFEFHQSVFLKHLEVYEDMPEDMGHVFVTFADRFNVLYVPYCKNKPESDQLLLQYGTGFFDELQNSAGMLDPIGSYLIKPVQRITKYQLLLKDLLTCCDDVNGEIKEALEVMTNVPKKANDAIHFSMLVGMPPHLNEQSLGELHLQDVFTVWSGKQILAIRKGRDRHVFLFDSCVIFSKETKDMTLPNSGKMRYIFKTSLPLRELSVLENVEGKSSDVSDDSHDCRFALCADDVRIILKASKVEVKSLWVRKVRELIKEFSLPDSRLAEQLQRSKLTAMKHAISRHNLMQIASAATAPDNDDAGSLTDPANSAGDASSIDERNLADFAYLTADVQVPVANPEQNDQQAKETVHLNKGQHVEVLDWQLEMSLVRVSAHELFVPTNQLSRAKSIGSLSGGEHNSSSVDISNGSSQRISFSMGIPENGTLKVKSETTVASLKRWFSGKRRIKQPQSPSIAAQIAARRSGASSTELHNQFGKSSSPNLPSGQQRDAINRKASASSRIISVIDSSNKQGNNVVTKTLSLSTQLFETSAVTSSSSNSVNFTARSESRDNSSTTNNCGNDRKSSAGIFDHNLLPAPPPTLTSVSEEEPSVSSLPLNSNSSTVPPPPLLTSTNILEMDLGVDNPPDSTLPTDQADSSANSNGLTDKSEQMSENNGQPTSPDDAKKEQALLKRRYIIQELVDTERDYVKDLGLIVSDYKVTVLAGPLPEGLSGKEKVVFGNIEQIYEWHRDTFLPEIEKCVDAVAADPSKDAGTLIAITFNRYERRLQMYVKYCENKPKADYLVADYLDFFEELRVRFGHKLNIADLLIKPVQRIMKYQLLIKDILKQSERAAIDSNELRKSYMVMQEVPKSCNDMMVVGRLQDFPQSITAQGKLLLQDRLMVQEPDSNKLNERQVFLFEQIVIISEVFERKTKVAIPALNNADFKYKSSILANRMTMQVDQTEKTRFFVSCRSAVHEAKYIFETPTLELAEAWTREISGMLQMQKNFIDRLSNPKVSDKKGQEKSAGASQIYQNIKSTKTAAASLQPPVASQQNSLPVSSGDSLKAQKSNASTNLEQTAPEQKEQKKKKGLFDGLNKLFKSKSNAKKHAKESNPSKPSNNEGIPVFAEPVMVDQTVSADDTATFSCKISSHSPVTVTWHYGCANPSSCSSSTCPSLPLSVSTAVSFDSQASVTVASMTVSAANASQNDGVYTCRASNASGSAMARATLNVS